MLKRILKKIKPIVFLANLSKRIILPGFQGTPLFNVLIFFFRGIQKGAITTRASSLSFNFFLAIFPTIIFLFTLIPYIPIHNFQDELMGLLKNFLPKSAFEATESTLEDIIKHQRGGLLSFGFIAALYFSTNGVNAMIDTFNNTYHSMETRTPLMQRLVSLLLVIIQTLLIFSAIALIIASEILLQKFVHKDNLSSFLIMVGRWLIIFFLFFCAISFTYYLGPAKKSGWKFFTAGSSFATILSIATSLAFAYYINNFGQYNKLYGSIGTLIVILLWIYFNSIILLLGFELNASIHNAKDELKSIE